MNCRIYSSLSKIIRLLNFSPAAGRSVWREETPTWGRAWYHPCQEGGWGSLCSCPVKHIHVLSALSPGWIEGLQRLNITSNWNTPNFAEWVVHMDAKTELFSLCWILLGAKSTASVITLCVWGHLSACLCSESCWSWPAVNQSIMAEALSLFYMFRKNRWSRQDRAPDSCCAKGCTVNLILQTLSKESTQQQQLLA